MSRSSKKGPYVDPRVMQKVQNSGPDRKIIKTWSRACQIPPEFVGHTFAVHNGKQFIPVFVTENMIGHRLGEFSPTRKFKAHGGRLAKGEEAGAPTPGAVAPGVPGAAAPTSGAPAAKK